MRLSLKSTSAVYIRLIWSVNVFCLLGTPAIAQTELEGTARDIARAAIIYPVAFDPLLVMPLTPGPEGVVDLHGSDIAGTYHLAVRNRDDSYGILVSVPLSSADSATSVDPRGMRRHASLGIHLTNVIWHPRTKPGTTEVDSSWALFIHADYRFNRAEYEFAAPATLERRTDTRLNDTASMLFGAQLFARPRDPGYFFGFSYIYSAVFDQFGGIASNGLPVEGPTKVRGNLLRVEMRRPFAGRFGLNPAFTYEKTSGVSTAELVGYARLGRPDAAARNLRGAFLGLRLGDESKHGGRGGFFATAFVGWEGLSR